MSLKDLLKDRLSREKISILPGGFEVIGDIAIINIPQPLDNEKYLIAEALVSHRKDIRAVLRKTHKLKGARRTGEFELLLGDTTETLHNENGCIFHVDIAKTYFSGKLAYERNRIVQKVSDGEDVLVLFCGVGPFLMPIKKKRDVNITGLDNNPTACALFKKNAQLNNIDAAIILADANSIDHLFKKPFDRIVMPIPYGQDHFLNIARSILAPEGIIHFYTFKKDFEIPHFKRLLEIKGWQIDFYRACGGIAPRVKRYVFDLRRQQFN
ncbi:putative methyltransferase [Candidatus Methanoperedens nitroreducens]|uniref:Putative methyltransferase n=1 Tax=Candidatus Methanoperedens nitratireducens TaxID=1392998 RepID=A0A062V2W3_9EURY|nr:methyltransferase domain-containing protein [Candidatus Methanoperedens nitroreducens]KCZ71712.1 putative methyltransferase [Candidatus Methanoperedens nitroreducens]MDJ1422315.1 methyltransferase domain-containing protein [Candidatus Methanoperedens sp.]